MRLLRVQFEESLYAFNVSHIKQVYISKEGYSIYIVQNDFKNTTYILNTYKTKEICQFAFDDLLRRLSEDHKQIDIMSNEQALKDLLKREGKDNNKCCGLCDKCEYEIVGEKVINYCNKDNSVIDEKQFYNNTSCEHFVLIKQKGESK